MTVTVETLHADLVAFRQDFVALRQELKTDIIRLEAKIDGKPSIMAMFTGIVVVVFGMAGVIASTIATLGVLHLIGHAP
jgi:hypothetical protein